MKHITYLTFISIFFSVLICTLPLRAIAFTDEGPVLWNSGGDVMERFHSEVFGTLGAPSVAIAGVDAKFIVVKADPLTKEFVLGIQDSAGTLRAYHSTDGVNWIADWNVVVGDGNVPRFDVAYEQLTGRAIIAYRGRISGGKTTFYYRVWNGTAWSAQAERTGGPTTGNIVALKLASRANSNQLGLIYLDDTHSGGAATWSGSAWAFWNKSITTNGTVYTGFAGIYPPLRGMDISFESLSGDLLVVMGENSTNRVRWATRTAAGAWSAVNSLTTLSGYGDFLQLKPSPTTNEIILSSCTMEPSIAQYLCEVTLWGGAGFGPVATDPNAVTITDGTMPTDAFWLVDGANRVAIAVYGSAGSSGIDWFMSQNGGAFAAQTPDTSLPTTVTTEGQILSVPIGGFPSQSLVLIADASNAGYMKRVTLSGTNVSWASVAPGSVPELTTWTYPVPDSLFMRMGMALQIAPPVFVVSTTSASTVTDIPSGSTSYVADTACSSVADCTGYMLTTRGKSAVTVSRIMLTNTGSVDLAQTSNWSLDIDTDANPNNGITRTVSGVVSGNTITFTFSPTLAVSAGQRLYAFPKATFGNAGAYPSGGQTLVLAVNTINDVDTTAAPINDEVLIGIPTIQGRIAPNITGYTNTTESGLSHAAGCTNCGGRLGIGTFAQSITITGFGFGVDPGAANRASVTNQVVLKGAANTTIASANVTSWSNTQVVLALDAATTGNADADFGSNYGGTGALTLIASGVSSAGVNFYLFPQITGLIVPAGLGPDGAKEFSTGDTDGVITLLGTRFGASQNTSLVHILGCSVTTCTTPNDSATIESWSNTAVKVEVPQVISDSIYTGTITLLRDFPTSAAASVDYANVFSVRPRITAVSPTSGGGGDAITLSGNHLCPTSGVCPTGTLGTDANVTAAPGFSSSNNVVLGGATADYWNSWSHTQVITDVPMGASLGLTTVVLTAGTFTAGSLPFTVVNNNAAGPPSGLAQFATTTQNTSMISGGGQTTPAMSMLAVGDMTAVNTIYMGAVITSASGVPGNMRLAVEVQPVGSAFVCGAGACATEKQGPLVAGPATVDCTIDTNNCRVSVTLPADAYHWRARTEYTVNSITYYSSWVPYPSSSPNLETAADFLIDQTPPSILNMNSGSPSTNSVTLTWDTNEPATQLVQINKTGVFTNSCVSGNGCTSESLARTLSHTASLSNLDSNTLYYYRFYAADGAGNYSWSSVQQFTTLGVTQPAKTIFFHALTSGITTSAGAVATSTFVVVIPEASVQYQSIFLDIRGLYQTAGNVANATLSVQVNNEAVNTYALPGGRPIFAPWRLYHKVSTLNVSPGSNVITITAGADTALSSIGADVIITYSYTP